MGEFRLVYSLKIPVDAFTLGEEDYSHLCDQGEFDSPLYEEKSLELKRIASTVNLPVDDGDCIPLSEKYTNDEEDNKTNCDLESDIFPWDEDLKEYPGTDQDIKQRPYLYSFVASGYKCVLERTHYKTWKGSVFLTSSHYANSTRFMDLLKDKRICVHGGLTESDGKGRFSFDCNHSLMDVSPLERRKVKGNSNELKRLVGSSITVPSSSLTDVCHNRFKSGLPRSYKAYTFAKRELTKLAEQFRTIEETSLNVGSTSSIR